MTLDTFQLGTPVEHRGIVITPLFPRRDPVASYITLDEALPRGLRITETSASGSVPELSVENPIDSAVLLYDGEELVGAKQNRILNVSVLVGADAKLPIPVSCVEQGRWSRQSDAFGSAKHISHSHLRRRKAETLAAQPLARGVAQGQVWDEVREKQSRMGVRSETGREPRHVRGARRTAAGAREGVRGRAGPVRRRARARRRPVPRRRVTAGCLRAPLAEAPRRVPPGRARAARPAPDVRRAHLGIRRRGRRGARHARAVGRARRGHACSRRDRHRLGAHARRRDDPALGVHELGRRRARLREDCPAEPPTLKRVGLLRR